MAVGSWQSAGFVSRQLAVEEKIVGSLQFKRRELAVGSGQGREVLSEEKIVGSQQWADEKMSFCGCLLYLKPHGCI